MNKNMQRLRRKPGTVNALVSRNPDGTQKTRLCLSPGDPLRWAADEMAAAPDELHIIDVGGGPLTIIPRDCPGIIEEFRREARVLDNLGGN